jgi:hypothetical protein
MSPRILIVAVMTWLTLATNGWSDDAESRRLARLASYLRVSGEALYGQGELKEKKIPADVESIAKEVGGQYADIFGREAADKQRVASERAVKALEERVFEILKALWGPEWPRVIQTSKGS